MLLQEIRAVLLFCCELGMSAGHFIQSGRSQFCVTLCSNRLLKIGFFIRIFFYTTSLFLLGVKFYIQILRTAFFTELKRLF